MSVYFSNCEEGIIFGPWVDIPRPLLSFTKFQVVPNNIDLKGIVANISLSSLANDPGKAPKVTNLAQ